MNCFYNCSKLATKFIKSKTYYGDMVYAALCDDHMKLQKGKQTEITESEFVIAMVMEI